MAVADSIRQKLTTAIAPERMEIIDESHLHAGHAGAREGGESHFRLEIVAAAFEGHSRVARQRMIYDILAEELGAGLHALTLSTRTPDEAAGD